MIEIVEKSIWVQSREDLNFPHVASYGEDRFGLFFSRGRHSVMEWPHYLLSEDGCRTWRDDASAFRLTQRACPYFLYPHLKLRDGTLMALTLKRRPDGIAGVLELTSSDAGRTWCEAWRPIDCSAVAVYADHTPIGLAMWGPVLELGDGRLYALGYTHATSEADTARHQRVILLERRTNETTWREKSVVFRDQADMREGVNETSIAQLDGSRIVAVCRTGYPDSPMRWAHSDDGGRTWSDAQKLPWSAVFPVLYIMGDGTLVMIFGARRQDKLHGALTAVASKDGGEAWGQPLVVFDGPGSCYHYGAKLGPEELLVPYANSQFRRPELPQFTKRGVYNQICAVRLHLRS